MSELRTYECEFYRCKAHPRSCLFCDHCTDIYWDYTNGPYMVCCDIEGDTMLGSRGECGFFFEESEV